MDIWVIRDNVSLNNKNNKQNSIGVSHLSNNLMTIQIYRVSQDSPEFVSEISYQLGSIQTIKGGRLSIVLNLLKQANISSGVVVVPSTYGNNKRIIPTLANLGVDFVLGLSPSTEINEQMLQHGITKDNKLEIKNLSENKRWEEVNIFLPKNLGPSMYKACDLGKISQNGKTLRLFSFSIGGIKDLKRNMVFGVTSLLNFSLKELIKVFGWVRWLQPVCRRSEKDKISANEPKLNSSTTKFKELFQGQNNPIRATIKISKQKDKTYLNVPVNQNLCNKLIKQKSILNVVELFAGAGGMGLGFLLATHKNHGYKIIYSGEVSPICVQTLHNNHTYLNSLNTTRHRKTPDDIVAEDLQVSFVQEKVNRIVKESSGVDVLIGGPPCQGFSNANRNSRYSGNPNNHLINTFFDYVSQLMPRVFLLENVQGILWTPKIGDCGSNVSVAHHIADKLTRLGYLVFPKLLDAVWYGVPQFRSRFFLIGIHTDLDYKLDDFGKFGPFPKPTHGPGTEKKYVNIKDAIGDLPIIGNGAIEEWLPYKTTKDVEENNNYFLHEMRKWVPDEKISDHITSKHEDYVISRYKLIPPGNNWQSISHLMTNYSNVTRTHSNIYRRLVWNEPSVTIGHYRKSMLVHPEQHRGLSLREASRLQSFPDWFRFAGSTDNSKKGLMYKQQQLANAVCPLLTKAIAEYILKL